ncbi:PEP/pyruvate-binding domain-containing protein [Spartinivicinus ruber]|uniref:PEP/pyruvate-binding domain-containing protein n=1 Tax=Spartinivicinus ruber TaxID=2683272 RepID=UPI0013D2FA68|nr:PEP/pyruvate-binding domain-containing protein [Spartinivicinus ruber]
MNSQPQFIEVVGNSENSKQLGGKASSLSKLINAGFPVPAAYCVTVSAYHSFLSESGLDTWISNQDTIDADTCAEIRNKIQQTTLPVSLHTKIIDAYKKIGSQRVAIRSSATNEDGIANSYAGQYDTYLHIEGDQSVTDCVKRCWGSIWTDRAHTYQVTNTQDFSLKDLKNRGIAVVIQEMVDADIAGVLFTTDPINDDTSCIVIEACWGLGEGVVSGQVTTDTFVVTKDNFKIAHRVIRQKLVRSGYSKQGAIELLDVPENNIEKPTLTDEQVQRLAKQALAIRQHYNQELDIEWAIKDDNIWILQARPVTTAKQTKKLYADTAETSDFIRNNTMFSRMDTGEIVTGLMSPLGLSFCRFYQHNIHGPAVKTMGLLDIGHSQHYMGYIQGHVYLNISASAQLLTQCPPTHDPMKFTTRYATDSVDFSHYVNPYGSPVSGVKYLKSSLYWFGCQIRNMASAGAIVKKMVELRKQETQRFHKLDLSSMNLADLNQELQRIDKYFLEACAAYMPFFLQSFALYDLLKESCEKWLGDTANGLQNRIKASMNGLRTIEVTKSIANLANEVKQSPHLTKLFLNTPVVDLPEVLKQDNKGRKFWYETFANFLMDFGSRGHQEFELTIPRWNDDPNYLLQVIRMYLSNEIELDSRLDHVNQLRAADTRQLLSKLPWTARLKLKLVIAAYGKMAERREATRPTYIAETWFYRKIIYEVASRLEKQGTLKSDDIPYIDFNDLRDYIAGRKSADDAFPREKINQNRHDHLANQRVQEPPMALIGAYTPKRANQSVIVDDSSIQGFGASPGTVLARARVITDLNQQAETFQQGEILVAKFTDASWTPLFALAAGVISDIGSMLSHSSIVSREFGIPAVVNTMIATQQIKTGDLLYLDGDTGIIRIEEKNQNTP